MNKLKVQVPTRGIDARDLDNHTLAQFIASPRVGTCERERILVELEPLVAQALDRNQAFDLRQVQAHKEAHPANPRDGSGIALAQTVLIVLGNLDLLRRMAGGIGRTLGIAACAANLRQNARQRLAPLGRSARRTDQGVLAAELLIGQLQFEHAVHHQIGVATDGLVKWQ